jgi:hypothetical protein
MPPQMMPPPQIYRPTVAPTQWVVPPPRNPPAPAGVTTRPGPVPYYGRTRAQVEAEGRLIEARAQDVTREATRHWKPNARPEDFFWCWNPERTVRMLLSFATIESFQDGGVWHNDDGTGIAYYVRGTTNI